MSNSRLNTFVGFALRSGSVVFGFDSIKKSFKKVFGVLISENLAENTKKQLEKFCNEKKISCKVMHESLDCLFQTTNCKIVGITNKELLKQILKCEE